MFARSLINFPPTGRQNPFTGLERLARQMDLLTKAMEAAPATGWPGSSVFPAVNVTEDTDKYYVRAELPGIKADAIDLQVNGRNLMISGERKIPSEGDTARYHRREREAGKFSRVLGLPGDINADSVDARMTNGVLMVTISKAEAAKPKQIKVN